jgi:hypothetical protein
MISALALASLLQTSKPVDWNDVLTRIDKAFHDLASYTDVWEFTSDSKPGWGLKYTRLIDGKKTSLRISIFDPDNRTHPDQLIFISGANGKDEYGIVFPAKTYYSIPDKSALFDENGRATFEKGSFYLGAVNFGFAIFSNPAPKLKNFTESMTQIGPTRTAVGEAINPATGNKMTIEITLMKRFWIPTDITATVDRKTGGNEVLRFHPASIMMGAKLPKGAFTFDRSLVKHFAKKTKNEIQQSLASLGG